jgi:hypothetical protein
MRRVVASFFTIMEQLCRQPPRGPPRRTMLPVSNRHTLGKALGSCGRGTLCRGTRAEEDVMFMMFDQRARDQRHTGVVSVGFLGRCQHTAHRNCPRLRDRQTKKGKGGMERLLKDVAAMETHVKSLAGTPTQAQLEAKVQYQTHPRGFCDTQYMYR